MIWNVWWSWFYYFIRFIIKMRREKSQTPYSLGAKRSSLPLDKAVAPYRIEWQNDSNSNVFFQNMKEELSNIKNDFEKLIKKEGSMYSASKQQANSNTKNKSMSYRKEDKKFQVFKEGSERAAPISSRKDEASQYNQPQKSTQFDKINLDGGFQAEYQSYTTGRYGTKRREGNMQWTVQDPVPIQEPSYYTPLKTTSKEMAGEQNKKQLMRMQDQIEKLMAQIKQAHEQISSQQKENNRLQDLVLQLQSTISKLHDDINAQKKSSATVKKQFDQSEQQKQVMRNKMEELSKELGRKMDAVVSLESKVKELKSALSDQNKSSQQTHSVQLVKLQCEQTINNLKQEHLSKLKTLSNTHANKISQLTQQHKLEINRLNEIKETQVARLTLVSGQNEVDMRQQHQKQLTKLRQDYQGNIKQIKYENENKINTLKNAYAQEVGQMQNKTQQRLLLAQKSAQDKDSASTQQLETIHLQQIQQLDEKHKQQIRQLDSVKQQEIQRLQLSHQQKLREFQVNHQLFNKETAFKYENRINQLQNQLNRVIQQKQTIIRQTESTPNVQNDPYFQNLIGERDFLIGELNRLGQNYNNLTQIADQLSQQNNGLKEQLNRLSHYLEDVKRMQGQQQNTHNRKIQYMKNDMKAYQQREQIFSKEISNLQSIVNQLQAEKKQLQSTNSQQQLLSPKEKDHDRIDAVTRTVQKQNRQLKQDIQLLKQALNQQTQSKTLAPSSSCQNFKLDGLIQQNQDLKNMVNLLQAEVQQLNQKNKAFKVEIALYQKREQTMGTRRQLQSNEWQQLTEQIERLKEEKNTIQQRMELQFLQREVYSVNERKEIEVQESQKLESVVYQQLAQIQSLRQSIERISSANQRLEKQVKLSKLTKPLQGNTKEIVLQRQLQSKAKKVQTLRQIIFKVLVAKAQKCQQEREGQYLIRKINQLAREWQ